MRMLRKPANFDPARWLRHGMSPRRLALTLALGFAIGCIPMVGVPTVLCAALAILFGLNQPAIQAANYAAMPLQIDLLQGGSCRAESGLPNRRCSAGKGDYGPIVVNVAGAVEDKRPIDRSNRFFDGVDFGRIAAFGKVWNAFDH